MMTNTLCCLCICVAASYWLIAMPEFNVGSQNICDGQGCAAVVDSGTSLWTVPTSMWDSFLDAVLGSKCTPRVACHRNLRHAHSNLLCLTPLVRLLRLGSGIYTSPTLGLITCPGTTYDDFPDIRLWFSSDTSSGKGVYQNFTSRQYVEQLVWMQIRRRYKFAALLDVLFAPPT